MPSSPGSSTWAAPRSPTTCRSSSASSSPNHPVRHLQCAEGPHAGPTDSLCHRRDAGVAQGRRSRQGSGMVVDPVLIEVLRGDIVESRHRGAVAVLDADGAVVRAIGDIDQAVFPRSAVKLIQALPLVESGAAAALGLGDRELALACSSHSGESRDAALAAAMLSTVGLDETALECGAHWPLGEAAALELARAGKTPGALHNNCSGKHAGFLCTCHRLNLRGSGYVGFDHPLQALL